MLFAAQKAPGQSERHTTAQPVFGDLHRLGRGADEALRWRVRILPYQEGGPEAERREELQDVDEECGRKARLCHWFAHLARPCHDHAFREQERDCDQAEEHAKGARHRVEGFDRRHRNQ